MKAVLVLTGVLILLAILLGALIVPCTPPSERADCRKEIGRLRGYLLSQDFLVSRSFQTAFSRAPMKLSSLSAIFATELIRLSGNGWERRCFE